MTIGGIDAPWLWLIVAALLAITELVLPGIFLVWIAVAALLTGIVSFVLPIGLPLQLVLFGLFSIAMVVAGRRIYERSEQGTSDPLLNDRTARLVGQLVTVVTPIAGGEGRVRVGDGIWSARGPDAPAGARVRIVGAEGICLQVEPVDEAPLHLPPATAAPDQG